MKNTIGALFLILLAINAGYAQTTSGKTPGMKLTDVQLMTGFAITPSLPAGLETFRSLAPESDLLKEDFTGYNHSGLYWSNGYSQMEVLVGFQFYNKAEGKYRDNMLFRVGFSYSPVSVLNDYYYKSESHPYDTLTSSRTGEQFYIDSVYSTDYTMEYGANLLSLNASVVWRTNPESRFNLYGGFGTSVGISLESYVSVGRSRFSDVQSNNFFLYPYGQENSSHNFENEYIITSNTMAFGFNGPLGVNFRIGKNNDLLKHLHIFYEFRPGIQFQQIQNDGFHTRANLYQAIGLRYS